MDASFYIIFGAANVLLGLLYLRRAYVGQKRSAIITLSQPTNSRMTRRERLMLSVSGWLCFATAIFYLAGGLRHLR